MASRRLLPGYFDTISSSSSKERYKKKLQTIGGLDPYEMNLERWEDDVTKWPGTSYIHVGMYLVFSPSPYTGEDMLNYKSLDCYQRFVAGWVREILVTVPCDDKRVVTAKVNHSQKLRGRPLLPWVICETGGKILCGHCNCMAGLGESCSHVASLLWAIEAGVSMRDSLTVTQKKSYWILPSSIKNIPYAPIKDIKFHGKSTTLNTWKSSRQSSAVARCDSPSSASSCISPSPSTSPSPSPSALLDHDYFTFPASSSALNQTSSPALNQTSSSPSHASPQQRLEAIKPPSDNDITNLFASLAKCKSKPSILALSKNHMSSYIPLSKNPCLPSSLSQLYNSDYLNSSYMELLKLSTSITVSVTPAECTAVEESTKNQSQSGLWFNMRTGRITASKLRAVCVSDESMPPLSLIMSICYPELSQFKASATVWGCTHEKTARENYMVKMSSSHDNFSVKDNGFFIHARNSFLGASPDGLVSCCCCDGQGLCEIKCPYCHKDDTIEVSINDRAFCLEKIEENVYQLKKMHSYYYQVQCQLYCTERQYCDFVVWTKEDLHIERILPDNDFITTFVEKAKLFFGKAILPELLGKFFSRPPCIVSSSCDHNTTADDSTTLYCYCQQPENDEMVACDNHLCPFQWFHFPCLKITTAPTRKKWYCPDCRKLPQFKRKGSK